MKKAKVLFSAITILAIAGGALAFKAHKGGAFTYYVGTATTTACTTTLVADPGATIAPGPVSLTSFADATLTSANGCTAALTIFAE